MVTNHQEAVLLIACRDRASDESPVLLADSLDPGSDFTPRRVSEIEVEVELYFSRVVV